jgi:hypothetical protein
VPANLAWLKKVENMQEKYMSQTTLKARTKVALDRLVYDAKLR